MCYNPFMSYDRINPDGSITRMPGTYNVKKNKAAIAETIARNDKIRADRKKQHAEGIADRAERIASYLSKLRDGKRVKIEDYIPHD